MPFGWKPNPTPPPLQFDFDSVYRELIAPAIAAAGMEPLRADEEMSGGLIHQPMYERLLLCEFAVADLSTANANVLYELGIRHAVRPWSTVLLFAEGTRLPFDVAPLRGLRYPVTETGTPRETETVRKALTEYLVGARKAVTDSPLFQTVQKLQPPDLTALQPESFYDRIRNRARFEDGLAQAVKSKQAQLLQQVEQELGDLSRQDFASLTDLFYAYRSVGAWVDMVRLYGRMPDYVAAAVAVQEQYALALNRTGEDARAERVLLELIERRGPSSETYGILGRVYKDRWTKAAKAGKQILAQGFLDKAIEAYARGFEADPRDFYPGVNAVTLMNLRQPPDARGALLLPVVRYALERRMRSGQKSYWEYATELELAVLASDINGATAALSNALATTAEPWMWQTTANNLSLIRVAREQRSAAEPWIQELETALMQGA
jgi:hypothetical protein